jgi:phosphohistidine phosphatase
MRRLLLFRHAKSSRPPGTEDHDRPLAERGRRASKEMGRFMAGQGLRPDLVLVSTSRRTQETWARAAPVLAGNIPAVAEGRLYEATPETLLAIVRQTASDVRALMLVGHNPGLEDFARRLIGEGEKAALSRLREKFPTAALAAIDFELDAWADLSWASGRLERFDTPKSVAAEGR